MRIAFLLRIHGMFQDFRAEWLRSSTAGPEVFGVCRDPWATSAPFVAYLFLSFLAPVFLYRGGVLDVVAVLPWPS